ncbi:hypothetical protein J132_09539 [Termitomyces sp. J132]|nr:hypothetical protein J132_09539 [Termitomyces sp. J132]
MQLVRDLRCKQSAILTQLRTSHIALNQYLFHIKQSETPVCPNCLGLMVETIHHFLFECLHYQQERHVHLRTKLRCKAESLQHLLATADALKYLFRFIRSTQRFKLLLPSDST